MTFHAFTTWNFDSINVLLILIVTVISFLAGKFVKSRISYGVALGLFVTAMTLFQMYDWS